MRSQLTIAVLIALTALNAAAQSGAKPAEGAKMDHSAMSKPGSQAQHHAQGVVKNVDRNKNAVVMAHGPVASLKWPAMTMSFAVKDKSLLDKLPLSKQVDFAFVQHGKEYVITYVK